jgi:citrate lyase beta subunit
MRHFGHLAEQTRRQLFHREPAPFGRDSEPELLAAALGATLYAPATRPALGEDIRRRAAEGVTSMVLCLEDAIDDAEVAAAEENVVRHLAVLPPEEAPLLFLRVRSPEQIATLTARLGPAAALLSGFVLPKFTDRDGPAHLAAVAEARARTGLPLYAMPVLESPELAYLESRPALLAGVARLLAAHRPLVLAARLGVTDLCAAYGLRRPPGLTAYDLPVVASVIGDVVNVLCRADGSGFTVSGPVWEYFPQAAFGGAYGREGLLREIALDRANGLLGKTCIHPSHVPVVHASLVVSHEEWSDAADILGEERAGGGVLRSAYRNKMNEVKPHRAWARQVVRRAAVYGVSRADVGFSDLLAAAGRAEQLAEAV